MKKQIILLVLLLVILGLLYVIFGNNINKTKNIENDVGNQNADITDGFTSEDLYYGCYWGDFNKKKVGTPADWVLVHPGSKSAKWCAPKEVKGILAPDPDQQGAKIRNEMSQIGCPDEMIVDKMPSVIDDSGVIPPPKAYYIKDGKRVEVADYNAVWVSANCEVPVLEVR